MKILQVDSPLMRILNKVADLLLINVLTLVLSVPIVTAGAAFTALHYCSLKIVRDQEVYIFKQYFHSFKDNFKQSTVIGLIFFAVAAFVGVDLYLLYANATESGSYVFWGLVLIAVLWAFLITWVFPIQAKFSNTIPKTLKYAFVYSFRKFPITLLLVVVEALPFLLAYLWLQILPILLCFCFSAPAILAAYLYNKDFKAMEDKYFEEHPAEDLSAEDEHIFSDNYDEIESKDSEEDNN